MTRSPPTNTTQRQQRQHSTILTSILIIGILAIGTFIQLLQTVESSNSSRGGGGNSTTTSTNHNLRVKQDNTDVGEKIISIAKNEDEDRELPIIDELFEIVNYSVDESVDDVTNLEDLHDMKNQGNESSSGYGEEQVSSGKIIEENILSKKDKTETADDGHCIVVISKLYGNHTLSRVHKSLSWYKSITLESIRLATQHISSGSNNNSDAYVGILLSAEGAYATEAATSLEGLGSINGMPDIHTNTTAMLNQHIIPHLLQEHLCDVVSMVRIDADDMLLPDTFEYMRQRRDVNWPRDEKKMNNSTSSEGALVIGGKVTTRLTLAPPRSDGGDFRCLKNTQRNSYFSSAGLSVTLPVPVLLEMKNKFICMSDHTKLPKKIRSDMKEWGLHTLIEDKPLGVLTSTPLSGHFNQAYLGDNSTLQYCNETFLMSEFAGDIGRLIWKARDAIPKLTNDEWRQNSFVKEFAKVNGFIGDRGGKE